MTDKVVNISIIIPAKDEQDTIGKLLDEIQEVMSKLSYSWETIVVCDHCVDKTREIADNKKAITFTNQGFPGKGNALKVGFENATGKIYVMMDADYSHRPEDLPVFLDEFKKEDIGLVVGSRSLGGSDEYEIIRLFGNVFLTGAFCIFFGKRMTDALNGYKAFRASVFRNHTYNSKGFEIEIELLANTLRDGLKVVEVSSHERERAGGKMKSRAHVDGPKFLMKIIQEGIKYRFS